MPTVSPSIKRHGFPLLLLLCASFVVLGGAYLVAGFAQSKTEAQQQETQTRARRVNSNESVPQQPSAESSDEAEKSSEPAPAGKEKDTPKLKGPFFAALASRGVKLESVCAVDDPVSLRILEDYGAVYIASERVTPPPVCMFKDDAETLKFQNSVKPMSSNIGGVQIELQQPAMEALIEARKEARELGLDITPRGGVKAARRSFSDTLKLWNSRFFPALAHWTGRGRISTAQADALKKLPLHQQVAEVLKLEKQGIFFSKDFSKSILFSVAAPGTSQHISMLALDVAQFGDSRVRSVLARHGWFQTVKSDLPHFTYLGVEEKSLPSSGLRLVKMGGQTFWVPDFGMGNK